MSLAFIIFFLFTFLYLLLMLVYAKGWRQQAEFNLPPGFVPHTFVSVIIPARNEQANIAVCIRSIIAQNYPQHLFEIIVIDDHSDDDTYNIVNGFKQNNVKYYKLADYLKDGNIFTAYKKKAIALGIEKAKGELIITTDADCIAPADWLQNVASIFWEKDPVMIVAPVDYMNNSSLLQIFQSLDFMSMQGITAAANALGLGNMSNGANLAFSKQAFLTVNGYEGVDHLSSGDDYLLMMKLQKKYPGKIVYLRSANAIIRTQPQLTWSGFLQQRIRWASKSGKYDDYKLTSILIFVYLFNSSFLLLSVLGFFQHYYWSIALLMLLWKTLAELSFLFPVAAFFNKRRQLWAFPFLQPLHIIYIIIAGFLGFAGVYTWKGRKTK
jgi:cellulose synthase/poly-beta-1,6-N-acetylglucosamine synthase-like glycosyltransferase